MHRAFTAALVLAALLPAGSAAAAGGVAGVRVAIDSNATFPSYADTASRNSVVILQAWQTDRLRALKAANPNVKVLVYKNAAAACATAAASGQISCGVSAAQAESNGWLLLNTSGQPFSFSSYSWLKAADIGDPGYQDAWATNVLAELDSAGWDGVFMDDVNPTIRYHYDVSSVAKYPSDSAYQGAMRSLLAAVGPRLQAAGKLAIANFGSWNSYPSVIRGWLEFTSGGMDEQFVKWGTDPSVGYRPEVDWATQLQEAKEAQAAGKYFLAVTHSANGDARAARYGYGTALLAANGRTGFYMGADYTSETWFPEYDLPIGTPTGPETRDANGVHRRLFSNGLVLVNPTASTRSVDFGGTYSGSGVSSATAATMAPQTALILVGEQGPGTTAVAAPNPTSSPAPGTAPDATTASRAPASGAGAAPTAKSRKAALRSVRLRGTRLVLQVTCVQRWQCRGRLALVRSTLARVAVAGRATTTRRPALAYGRVVQRRRGHALVVFRVRPRMAWRLRGVIVQPMRATRRAMLPLPQRFVVAGRSAA